MTCFFLISINIVIEIIIIALVLIEQSLSHSLPNPQSMNSPITMKGFSVSGLPNTYNEPTFTMIDIGANLLDDMYQGKYNHNTDKLYHDCDIDDVLDRATLFGVNKIIVTAGNIEEATNALILCKDKSSVNCRLYTTVGIHPTQSSVIERRSVDEITASIEKILHDDSINSSGRKIVAIGEAGLDYDRLHFSTKESQMACFLLQIDIAYKSKLPMFLHDRNTNGDFLKVMQDNKHKIICTTDTSSASGGGGGVVHSFTGTMQEMLSYVELGLYIGINGCSLKTAENLEVVRQIPEHLLLLETDAPWCAIKQTHASHKYVQTVFPSKKKEKYEKGCLVKDRCEPVHMLSVFEVVAAIRCVDDRVSFASRIYENTKKLFALL